MKRLDNVLIVDDDTISNYITENVVRGANASTHTITVKDGRQALNFLRHQCNEEDFSCPDLIILDINMPLMDGVEFLEQYERFKNSNRTTVVALSNSTFSEPLKEKLKQHHVESFIEKPLTAEKILNVIEKLE